MSATKNLENDHEYILRLLGVMEKMITAGNAAAEDLERVIWLIREFADGFHHAKEENMLFPLMEEKGFSPVQGPVAVMLHEHVMGRNYVKGMSEGVESLKKGIMDSRERIHENMKGYILLLRNHISKENNILFRMADNVFSEAEQHELLARFSEVENAIPGAKGTALYTDAIEKLDKKY